MIGIGFGPSNLALATALDELGSEPGGRAIDAAFFEKQPALGWHRGMLLPGSKMQVSFLKDLATFRNPASPYSFVAYLHSEGRLAAFVNRKDFFPSRQEFHDYLEWVEARFTKYVTYNAEVVSVSPEHGEDGEVDRLRLEVRQDGTDASDGTRTVHARNIVVSTGLAAWMPDGIERGDTVWHSSEFITRFREFDTTGVRSVAVVGAGQSAAEILRFVYDNLPDAEVYAILSPLGFSVADNTPLANQVFDPSAVDDFFYSSERSKEAVWRYHRNTNYSVVDDELIHDLHERMYQDELNRRTRLTFLNLSRARSAEAAGGRTRVAVESLRSGAVDHLDVDLLVCATGYEPMDPTRMLGDLAGLCRRDGEGRLRVDRDYRVVTSPEIRCGIYLQGGTEHTHGLSSSLLSNIAVRSGEIANSIAQSCARPPAGLGGGAMPGPNGLSGVKAV
ncbi:lysine N(6)-hydroxylase/L-ornithine N(5)-oxygenase family protein [Actinomadura opuntiae]|uniref:lysine N(6)-hydroxylase/L-ornithine N(5)-oxygenase family protein n=1 Tax=Actinomadura sp. OS1-43 TaxID=604315 RepID=UPI00255A7A6C|nr:SidA/IucD/PvdA family monooxygenase [Actinomadura sp. OS1-43]MDL4818695.1 SidA/IucD/PvdA family monooxygenase [Actinomadura sp. OS1-43]